MINKQDLLNNYFISSNIEMKCISIKKMGYASIYAIKLAPKARINQLQHLTKELMLILNALAEPNLKINSKEGLLELEVIDQLPSERIITRELLVSQNLDMQLPINLGVSLIGNPIKLDLSQNPNLLIGGTTGSGKSNLLHLFINNILLNSDAEISILDTKGIEFSQYEKSYPHRVRIASSYREANYLVQSLHHLMEKRYSEMQYDIKSMITPNQVLIIDEFADLSLQDKNKILHNTLCRLAQKSRAAGIYSILATQRPSADIITGTIKANFPARIACKTASKIDSRIILDENGAENLPYKGGAIIKNYKYPFEKFQAFYVPNSKLPEMMSLSA